MLSSLTANAWQEVKVSSYDILYGSGFDVAADGFSKTEKFTELLSEPNDASQRLSVLLS